jgi:hypothetical protein
VSIKEMAATPTPINMQRVSNKLSKANSKPIYVSISNGIN